MPVPAQEWPVLKTRQLGTSDEVGASRFPVAKSVRDKMSPQC